MLGVTEETTDPFGFVSHCRKEADLRQITHWQQQSDQSLRYEYGEMYHAEWLAGAYSLNAKQARRMIGAILLSRGITEVEDRYYGQLVRVSTLIERPLRRDKDAPLLVQQVAQYLIESGVQVSSGGDAADIGLIAAFLEHHCRLPPDRFEFCYCVCKEMIRQNG